MNRTLIILELVSGLSFLSYGLLCVFSGHMISEFERYGLIRFRLLVGVLEVLGGLGILMGTQWPPLLLVSAAGLTLLMALGVAVRIRVGDRWIEMLPAAALFLVNAKIVWTVLEMGLA